MIRCQSCAFVFSVPCWGCSIMECVPTACRLHPDFAIPQRQGPQGYATTGTCTTKHVSFLAMRHHQLRQNAKTDEQGKSRCENPLDPAAPSPLPPGRGTRRRLARRGLAVARGAPSPVPLDCSASANQRPPTPKAITYVLFHREKPMNKTSVSVFW